MSKRKRPAKRRSDKLKIEAPFEQVVLAALKTPLESVKDPPKEGAPQKADN